jgi:hypothetical protein
VIGRTQLGSVKGGSPFDWNAHAATKILLSGGGQAGIWIGWAGRRTGQCVIASDFAEFELLFVILAYNVFLNLDGLC